MLKNASLRMKILCFRVGALKKMSWKCICRSRKPKMQGKWGRVFNSKIIILSVLAQIFIQVNAKIAPNLVAILCGNQCFTITQLMNQNWIFGTEIQNWNNSTAKLVCGQKQNLISWIWYTRNRKGSKNRMSQCQSWEERGRRAGVWLWMGKVKWMRGEREDG